MTTPQRSAPPLDTARLELRAHRLEDFDDMRAMWGDAGVVRHVTKRPLTEPEVWERLMRYAGQWALLGCGMWAIRERGTGRWIGEVGLFRMRRGLGPAFDDVLEAGWMLAAQAHGRGAATEAVQAIHAWADRELPAKRTVCLIDDVNAASLRVAEKLGYREYDRVRYNDTPVILFERVP